MGMFFGNRRGSDKLKSPIAILIIVIGIVVIGNIIATKGLVVALALLAAPIFVLYLNRFFLNPRIGIYSAIFAAFLAIGLTRYVPGVPLGLSMDGFLVLTYIAIFFKYFYENKDFSVVRNDLTLLALIWFLFSVAQFINPEALSSTAWFYAMRGMSLYQLLLIPLVFLIFNKVKYLYTFLYLWGAFSILATLKGAMQLYMGPDFAEQQWLDQGGAVTHILFGELRVFSFFSDAGQFGAAQAMAGVVGTILAVASKSYRDKAFFWLMALTGYYGMMISGTRGAMIVPFFGLVVYMIHSKNIRALLFGAIGLMFVYGFFKYTYIGQGIGMIRRMRTAFHPADDASLLVRIENRRILKTYLANKPFGGGIGSAGDWGARFSPNGFLANVATDSWYVQIWAEQGIIGLMAHLFIVFFIVIKSSYYVMFRLKDPTLRLIMSALISGIVGIMGASYGNGVFGQSPTGIVIYISMAFLWLGPWLDDEMIAIKKSGKRIFEKGEPLF
ncbi:MAG: O-antigen ligase family protein [Bacteroidales bacterium]|nr:O-antigen ligase family protein [Bacteroidales bacterium]